MFKMGFHDPFGYLKHKLRLKEGPRVKLAIWLPTIKSRKSVMEYPDFIVWRWRGTYRWKALNEGYNFAWDFTSIRGFTQSCRLSKLGKFQFRKFRDSHLRVGHLGVPRQNEIWVLALWPATKNTIKRKVVVSPESMLWWILCVYSWLVRAPKVLQLCINQLIVWFV